MYEDWGGSPEWEEKPRSCVCVHVALDAVQVGQTDGYSRWWWDDAIVKRRDSGRKRKCGSECRSCATLLSITSTRYRRNDCWWKVEGRRSMVNGACDRVSSGEVRDVSQYVVGMSLLLFPNCDTRNGKYFIGSSQQPQTLSCLAVPSLATGKLALLACLLSSSLRRERRGPMTIAQQRASTFFFSCRGALHFHGRHYLVHLSPSCAARRRKFSLNRGGCFQRDTLLLALPPHSSPVLPNCLRRRMRLLTLPGVRREHLHGFPQARTDRTAMPGYDQAERMLQSQVNTRNT